MRKMICHAAPIALEKESVALYLPSLTVPRLFDIIIHKQLAERPRVFALFTRLMCDRAG
jgi:hypothetical protein